MQKTGRISLTSQTRKNPYRKGEACSEWITTNAGSDINDWIIEHISPSKLGDQYIVLLQTHQHFHLPQTPGNPLASEPSKISDLEKEFTERADRWEKQTGIYSSPTKRFLHEDYQTIMTMGESVIPLILKRLQTKPNDWFWALKHFARKDMALGNDSFSGAVKAWLDWGIEKKYISAQ